MNEETWRKFFDEFGDKVIDIDYRNIDAPTQVSVETIYQVFKARFLDEYTPPGVVRVDLD